LSSVHCNPDVSEKGTCFLGLAEASLQIATEPEGLAEQKVAPSLTKAMTRLSLNLQDVFGDYDRVLGAPLVEADVGDGSQPLSFEYPVPSLARDQECLSCGPQSPLMPAHSQLDMS
jgi:hypothetical protein